jgi:hypothetical protein
LCLISAIDWPEHLSMAPQHVVAAISANAALAFGLALLFEFAQWFRARFSRLSRVWSACLLVAALLFSWCVGSELVRAVQRLAAVGYVHVIALSLASGCALSIVGMRTTGFGLRGSLGQRLTLLINVAVMALLLWAQHRYRFQLRESKLASVSAAFLLLAGAACLRVVERLSQIQSNGRGVAVLTGALALSITGFALSPEYPLRQLFFAGVFPGRILGAVHLPELLLHRAARSARQARFLDAASAQPMPASAAPIVRKREESRAEVVLFILVDALRADAFDRYVRDPKSRLHQLYRESCVSNTLYAPASETRGTLTKLLWRPNAADGFWFDQARQAGVTLSFVADQHLSTILKRALPSLHGKFDHVEEVPRLEDGKVAPLTAAVLPHLRAQGPQLIWSHLYDVHEWGDGDPHASLKLYEDSVARVGVQIAELVDAIAKSERKVSVIVTADHGEGLDHFSTRNHGEYVYEPLVRVPVLLWTHGHGCSTEARAALHSKAPSTKTWAPLALEELGIKAADGEPTLAQRTAQPIVIRASMQDAIIRWPHKLIVSPWFTQLFDLSTDPHELHDLSSDSKILVRELRDLLEDETRTL